MTAGVGGPWPLVESEAGWSGATWVDPGHFAGARIIGAAPKSAAKMSRLNVRGDCLERPGVIPGCSADALTDVGLRHGRGTNHAEDCLEPPGVIPGSSADASAGFGPLQTRGLGCREDCLEPPGVIPGSSADASADDGLQFVDSSDPLDRFFVATRRLCSGRHSGASCAVRCRNEEDGREEGPGGVRKEGNRQENVDL